MPDFAELKALFRQPLDSPDVEAFLAKYPEHQIRKPNSGSQHVLFRSLGFDLLFRPLTGPQGGPSKKLRLLITVFLDRAGKDKFQEFATPPFGITFRDTPDSLNQRLGPPAWTNLPHGVKSVLGMNFGSRWEIDGLDVHSDFDPADLTVQMLTISLPETRP